MRYLPSEPLSILPSLTSFTTPTKYSPPLFFLLEQFIASQLPSFDSALDAPSHISSLMSVLCQATGLLWPLLTCGFAGGDSSIELSFSTDVNYVPHPHITLKYWLGVLVCSGCYNKNTKTWWLLNNKHLFLIVLGAGWHVQDQGANRFRVW